MAGIYRKVEDSIRDALSYNTARLPSGPKYDSDPYGNAGKIDRIEVPYPGGSSGGQSTPPTSNPPTGVQEVDLSGMTGGGSSGGGGSVESGYQQQINDLIERLNGREDSSAAQLRALREQQRQQEAARQASYQRSVGELSSGVEDASKQAYINMRMAQKNVPQAMAAGGYSGGMTETAAGGIQSNYQNALAQLNSEKARTLAQLQSDLAAGVASDSTTIGAQIAQALANAGQQQNSNDYAMIDLLRGLQGDELARRKAGGMGRGAAESYSIKDVKSMIDAGMISADEGRKMLGGAQEQTTAPKSYQEAYQEAIATGSLQPMAAYWRMRGYTERQIADMLNQYALDPESAFSNFGR